MPIETLRCVKTRVYEKSIHRVRNIPTEITYRRTSPQGDVASTNQAFPICVETWLLYWVSALLLNSSFLRAQNCATPELHTQSASENTYYPGTTASAAAGSNTITLGAAGSGTNFGTTPIAIGDIVLIIQMQGAKINCTGCEHECQLRW